MNNSQESKLLLRILSKNGETLSEYKDKYRIHSTFKGVLAIHINILSQQGMEIHALSVRDECERKKKQLLKFFFELKFFLTMFLLHRS